MNDNYRVVLTYGVGVMGIPCGDCWGGAGLRIGSGLIMTCCNVPF